MKHTKKLLLLTALLALIALLAATPGCSVVNRLRAKNSLNEGVREFNKGKYQAAEAKFKFSLDLSPDMTSAQLFYARSLNSQFDQALTESLGLKTVKAYEDIIKSNPNDQTAKDQALAFEANIYNQMSKINPEKREEYKQKQHDLLLQRADLPGVSTKTKAEANYGIGVDFWQASYDLNSPYVSHHQPIPAETLTKMKPLIQKAHEYLQKAISIQPDYANAWFYEKLVYIEEAKTDSSRQAQLMAKATEMQNKYVQLNKQQQAAAAEAAPASQ